MIDWIIIIIIYIYHFESSLKLFYLTYDLNFFSDQSNKNIIGMSIIIKSYIVFVQL